jgi:nicotinamidase/pyrazinamidase
MSLASGDTLIIVDVQNDFLPSGALAAPDEEAVIEPLNRCITAFNRCGLPIFGTRDWHPANHCSLHRQGGPWPPHCVAGTKGAEFSSRLQRSKGIRVVSKATHSRADAYSGFQGTDLARQLHEAGCRRLFMGGLATEYCVRATALDARAAGFELVVLEDADQGVEVHPGDSERALADIIAHGVQLTSNAQALA